MFYIPSQIERTDNVVQCLKHLDPVFQIVPVFNSIILFFFLPARSGSFSCFPKQDKALLLPFHKRKNKHLALLISAGCLNFYTALIFRVSDN